jgi:hypothetical protein
MIPLILFGSGLLLFVGSIFGLFPKASHHWRAAGLCGCLALLFWSLAFILYHLGCGFRQFNSSGIGDPAVLANEIAMGLLCSSGLTLLPPSLILFSVGFFIRKEGM